MFMISDLDYNLRFDETNLLIATTGRTPINRTPCTGHVSIEYLRPSIWFGIEAHAEQVKKIKTRDD